MAKEGNAVLSAIVKGMSFIMVIGEVIRQCSQTLTFTKQHITLWNSIRQFLGAVPFRLAKKDFGRIVGMPLGLHRKLD